MSSGTQTDTYEVLIIEPGGEYRVEQLERSLSALQRIVGGYVQAVPSEDRTVDFWMHEEGKLIGLEPNPTATAMYYLAWPNYQTNDFLVGSVVITGGADGEGETLPIPAVFRDEMLELLKTESL